MRKSTLAGTSAATLATAVVGGLAANVKESEWYEHLRKPRYQPARQVFPVVWPVLYADIATVSASTIDRLRDGGQHDKARAYIGALTLNLVLNGSWSWLFFNRGKLAASAAAAAALTVSSADLSRRAVSARAQAGAPLIAYPAWCAFATVLSTHIWVLNRGRKR